MEKHWATCGVLLLALAGSLAINGCAEDKDDDTTAAPAATTTQTTTTCNDTTTRLALFKNVREAAAGPSFSGTAYTIEGTSYTASQCNATAYNMSETSGWTQWFASCYPAAMCDCKPSDFFSYSDWYSLNNNMASLLMVYDMQDTFNTPNKVLGWNYSETFSAALLRADSPSNASINAIVKIANSGAFWTGIDETYNVWGDGASLPSCR